MRLPKVTLAQKLAIVFVLLLAWGAHRQQLAPPTGRADPAAALDSALMRLDTGSLPAAPKRKLTFGKGRKAGRKQRVYDEGSGSPYRVLLTGDSMGDGLYLAWRKERKKGRFDLRYAPWYGSTTEDWGTTHHLAELIADYRPHFVIFSLGSNDLLHHKVGRNEKYLREIVRQLGQTTYIWVGPPNWKEDTGINRLIVKHVGHRYFFPSKNLQLERQPDGIHVTFAASEFWADTISHWVDRSPHYNFSLTGRRAKGFRAATSK
jgi:lysophospholipase L1-like esterase